MAWDESYEIQPYAIVKAPQIKRLVEEINKKKEANSTHKVYMGW